RTLSQQSQALVEPAGGRQGTHAPPGQRPPFAGRISAHFWTARPAGLSRGGPGPLVHGRADVPELRRRPARIAGPRLARRPGCPEDAPPVFAPGAQVATPAKLARQTDSRSPGSAERASRMGDYRSGSGGRGDGTFLSVVGLGRGGED